MCALMVLAVFFFFMSQIIHSVCLFVCTIAHSHTHIYFYNCMDKQFCYVDTKLLKSFAGEL